NGRWEESFFYKKHYIITLGSELQQEKEAYYDPGLGLNRIYASDYFIADFDKKVMRSKVLKMDKQIWLLVSRWAGDEYNKETMSRRLKKYFRLTLAKEQKGIKIYRFVPLN
ncbi:hypothetical protein ACFL5X_02500, partial [Candidatus Omnitrophota bacterium]